MSITAANLLASPVASQLRSTAGTMPPAHLGQLDGVRAVLAIYVVWHHIYHHAWPFWLKDSPSPFRRHALSWLLYGRYAVCCFIVLSGFCLALPVIRKDGLTGGTARFYANRCWRIVPCYWASILLCSALIATVLGRPTGTHWDVSIGLTFEAFLAAMCFLPEVFYSGSINHVLWSVAIETKIYLLFPGLVAGWQRFGLLRTCLIATALTACAMLAVRGTVWRQMCLWFIPLFLMGMLAATIATSEAPQWRRWRDRPWGSLAGAVACALIGLGYWMGYDWINAFNRQIDLAVGIGAAAALTALVGRPGRVSRWLATPWLVGVGVMTYSLYLIHAPLLQIVHQFVVLPLGLSRGWQFALLIPLGTLASLVGAWGLHVAVEKPSHRLARSFRRDRFGPVAEGQASQPTIAEAGRSAVELASPVRWGWLSPSRTTSPG